MKIAWIASLSLALLAAAGPAQEGAVETATPAPVPVPGDPGIVLEAAFRPFPTLSPPEFVCRDLPAPQVDGRLSEAVWADPAAQVGALTDDRSGAAPETAAHAWMVRRGQRLYVAFRCEDPDINARSPYLRFERERWPADGVYVFFGGRNGEPAAFAVDPRGLQYDTERGPDPAASRCWSAAVQMTATGWTAEMEIPFDLAGLATAGSDKAHAANFFRKRSKTGLVAAWAPTGGELDNPARYGGVGFDPSVFASRATGLRAYLDRASYPADVPVARLAVRLMGGRGAWRGQRLFVSLEPPRVDLGEEPPETPPDSILEPTGDLGDLLIDMVGVPVGDHTLTLVLGRERNNPAATARVPFARTPDETAPEPGEVVLALPAGEAVAGWPVRTGAAFPPGALTSVDHLRLLDAAGRDVPFQAAPLARWSAKGSIKWAALDFDADVIADAPSRYTLRYGPTVRAPGADAGIQHWNIGGTLVVDTGAAMFNVRQLPFSGIEEAWVDTNGDGAYTQDEQVIWAQDKPSGPYLVDEDGRRYLASLDPHARVRIEEAGKRRLSIRAEGWFAAEAAETGEGAGEAPAGPDKLGRFVTRIVAYAGKPHVRVQQTFVFTHDTSRVRLSELGIVYQADVNSETRHADFGVDGETRTLELSDTPARVAQTGAERCVFTGAAAPARRADGWLALRGKTVSRRGVEKHKNLAVVVRDMADTFPGDIEVSPGGALTVRAWPARWEEELPSPRLTPGDLGALETFHRGPLLDLSPPATALQNMTELPDRGAVAAALDTNGMGAAVTLDMVLLLSAKALDPEEVARLSRICAAWPVAAPDPASLARAGVLRRAPLEGDAAEKAADARGAVWSVLMAREQRDPQPGKFNHLDFHRRWTPDGRWTLDRHWVGNSHGVPALLWKLYAESGQPAFAHAAERNTRHVVDRAMCHYAAHEFERAETAGARKARGGFAEPATFVHWYAANGVAQPWARADFLALAYWLVGAPRALDALGEWTAALRRIDTPPSGDAGLAALAGLAPAYEMTGDAFLLYHLRRCFDQVLNTPPAAFDPRHYADAVAAYRRLAKPDDTRFFLARLADRASAAEDSGTNLAYLGIYIDAYGATGSERYLQLARRLADRYVGNPEALGALGWAEAASLLEFYPRVLAAE